MIGPQQTRGCGHNYRLFLCISDRATEEQTKGGREKCSWRLCPLRVCHSEEWSVCECVWCLCWSEGGTATHRFAETAHHWYTGEEISYIYGHITYKCIKAQVSVCVCVHVCAFRHCWIFFIRTRGKQQNRGRSSAVPLSDFRGSWRVLRRLEKR